MKAQLAVFGMSPWELLLIVAVIVLLFGASRLPKLAKGLGESLSEFRKAARDASQHNSPEIREPKTNTDSETGQGINKSN
jgi:sec-independent protein translocase protein TatA